MSRRLGVTILGLLVCVGCTGLGRQPLGEERGEPDLGKQLEALVHQVQESLQEAQAHDPQGFPVLRSASVTIQTVASTTRSGKLSYVVASIDRKKKAEHTSSLTLKLVPPPKKPRIAGGPGDAVEDVQDALASAIHLAKLALQIPLKADPKLVTDNVRLDVKFAVTRSTTAGLDSLKLLPIGVQGSVQVEQSKTHVIQLEFGLESAPLATDAVRSPLPVAFP